MQDANRRRDDQGIPADLIELGRVAAAYGVRGQIKIQTHAAGSDTLHAHKTWWLKTATAPAAAMVRAAASAPQPVHVLSCQRHNDTLIAQLEGVGDRDQAQTLKGATLHLPRTLFPKAAQDEYYWVDLIGCALYGKTVDGQDVLLGRVAQVSDNGAHALLHVAQDTFNVGTADAAKRTPERLIPFVAAHILHVDLPARRIDSNWPADF